MKKSSATKSQRRRSSSGLREEYRFDYSKAQPNRFAGRALAKSVVVLLAPDVAKVFKSADSVNEALRSIIKAVSRKRSARRSN
jgi:hypothetical protein